MSDHGYSYGSYTPFQNQQSNKGTGIPFLDSFGGYGAEPSATENTDFSFGLNPESFQMIGQGVNAFSSLANIYAGFKAMKLAKSKFRFQKDAWNKNYNAQVKDYDNTLKDRWTARNASAQLNNRSFESMGSWVGSRAIGS